MTQGDLWTDANAALLTRDDQAAEGATSPPAFEPLYHEDLLHVVNPLGDIGIVTLWSPVRTVMRKLDAVAPDLIDPARGRVAVIANLYGDGMLAMFCNLLYNPGIRHLVALGEDLGLATRHEIEAFLERGLEDDVMLGKPVLRVPGTQRVFPVVSGFDADRLRRRLSFRYLGRLSRPGLAEELAAYVDTLTRAPAGEGPDRVRVELPRDVEPEYSFRPSEPAAHQVVRKRPLDCWEELVVRTMRFGRPVQLRKGPRLELLNAKAVVTEPEPEPAEQLAEYGFDLSRFEAYQRRMLDPKRPEGLAYTYGNRLRGYFEQPDGRSDSLERAIELIQADPETRGAYISLWDTAVDLAEPGAATPCLVTLFFRRASEHLTLTATYRSHNLLWGWLENVYGLMAIQRHVAERVEMPPGSLTVISGSLGIDPTSPRYSLARSVAERWQTDDDVERAAGKRVLRQDPNGYFIVSVDRDRGCIVAEHRYGGVLVKRYEAERAVTIERAVAADMAISLVSHALWLGRELTTKERLLREDR